MERKPRPSPARSEVVYFTCLGLATLWSFTGCNYLQQRAPTLSRFDPPAQSASGQQFDSQHVSYEEPSDELELTDFAPENLSDTVRRLTGNGPAPETAQSTYAAAERLYLQAAQARQQNPQADFSQQFAAAADGFESAATQWPNSTLEHDALYMLGEANFFADRYPAAEEAFEELLKKYPNSKHLDRIQPRRFHIAQYWIALDDNEPEGFHEINLTNKTRPLRDSFGHGVRVLDRIRLDDPTGKLADDATLALGNAFFRRQQFIRADEYYTDLRKTFPSSDHQFKAHFLGLKAKLESYQGHDYSANSLKEAEKLVKQLRRQFPREAETEREAIRAAHLEIRYKLAEREWKLAEHYDRRAEFGAARFYYQAIIKDYGDTPFAARSEERLQAVAGRPSTPPQRLSWLVDMFPESRTATPLIATRPQGPLH